MKTGWRRNIALRVALVGALAMLTTGAQRGDERGETPAPEDELHYDLPISASPSRLLDVCGRLPRWQEVERAGDMPAGFVDAHADSTVLLRWRSAAEIRQDLSALIAASSGRDAPGNIAGKRWCTGTYLDDGRVLTAAHCFDPRYLVDGYTTPHFRHAPGQRTMVEGPALAPLLEVIFNYQRDPQGRPRTAQSYAIDEATEYSDAAGRVDYAIVTLQQNEALNVHCTAELRARTPHGEHGHCGADLGQRSMRSGDTGFVIQHPDGERKQIDRGSVLAPLDGLMRYDIDTIGGSSGAGVRDADGRVRGVHILAGCNTAGGNRATPIEAIINVSPTL
jgi:hypothetical protein